MESGARSTQALATVCLCGLDTVENANVCL